MAFTAPWNRIIAGLSLLSLKPHSARSPYVHFPWFDRTLGCHNSCLKLKAAMWHSVQLRTGSPTLPTAVLKIMEEGEQTPAEAVPHVVEEAQSA